MNSGGIDADRYARVRACFRRSLESYDAQAVVQESITHHLVERLLHVGLPVRLERVFEFGCGTGKLSRSLATRFSLGHLWLNDLVTEARSCCEGIAADTIEFLPGPVEMLTFPSSLDLICSTSTLQWIEPIAGVMTKSAAALRPGGVLALSTYGPRQFEELRFLGLMAGAPALRDEAALIRALPDGIERIESGSFTRRLWFPGPYEVLQHLRATGVNGMASGGWTRAQLRRFEEAYKERFANLGRGVPLTYAPVWLIAKKSGG